MTDQVSYRKWMKRGVMIVRADALDFDDPDHPYNQVAAQGVAPEDFGLQHPLKAEFAHLSQSQLINMIADLRKEIRGYQ
jgi:hypothetical protein